MSQEIAQVSDRGTLTLPAAIRRQLDLHAGDVLTIRVTGSSIVLTPAVVLPVEEYDDERIAEFDENSRLRPDELAVVREAWSRRRRT